jgi:hypothetical protein
MRCRIVAVFQITVVNDKFASTSEQEFADADLATEQAIRGALELGTEQVLTGERFFGAEVLVAEGSSLERFVVAVGVSPIR